MKPDRLSRHEREALGRFLRMTPEDVGARAAEFEASHAAAAEVEVAGAQDLVARGHDEVAARWRELERLLIERGLGRVGELDERDQTRWAQRLKALSSAFARPDDATGLEVGEEALRPPGDAPAVDSDDATQRQVAVMTLGSEARAKSGAVVARVLRSDPDENVRVEAARALGSIGGLEARSALLAGDPTGRTRRAIAVSLGLLGERAAVPKLIAWLDDEDVRSDAIDALGRIGDPAAVPALEALLSDARWLYRSNLRDALIAIGHPDAVAALRRHPRRNPLARAQELKAAERVAAQHGAREQGEIPPRLDRLVLGSCAFALRRVLLSAAFAVLPVALFDAPQGQVLTVAGVAALVLGVLGIFQFGERRERLDLARWRLEPGATRDHVAPALSTVARAFVSRPLRPLLRIAVVIGLEAATGATGIVAGAVAGLCVAWALSSVLMARRIVRWQWQSRSTLLADAARPASGRRFFSVPR